jgi:hypothetical protein
LTNQQKRSADEQTAPDVPLERSTAGNETARSPTICKADARRIVCSLARHSVYSRRYIKAHQHAGSKSISHTYADSSSSDIISLVGIRARGSPQTIAEVNF